MASTDAAFLEEMYAGFASLSEGRDVRRYVEAFYDPDCEYRPVEEAGTVRGHEELVRWNERWFESWASLDVEVVEIGRHGERSVAEVIVRARGAGSEMDVAQRIFHVFELRDGKILRMGEYLDRDEAVDAAAT